MAGQTRGPGGLGLPQLKHLRRARELSQNLTESQTLTSLLKEIPNFVCFHLSTPNAFWLSQVCWELFVYRVVLCGSVAASSQLSGDGPRLPECPAGQHGPGGGGKSSCSSAGGDTGPAVPQGGTQVTAASSASLLSGFSSCPSCGKRGFDGEKVKNTSEAGK